MSRLAALAVAAVAAAACAREAQPTPAADAQVSLVIRDVTVVDVVGGRLRPHMTVSIAGPRVAAVEATTADAPPGATVVDGAGRFLIPGLWDMHSHALWSAEAMRTFLPLYVAQGVTGIRDMGGRLDVLAEARATEARTDPPWPRLVAAGEVLDGPEPVQRDISIPIATPAEATAAVARLARAGVDFIKVYTLLSRDAYMATLAEAARVRVPVAGHVPADVTPAEAAQAGQKSIEHLRDEIDPLCTRAAPEPCARLAGVFREHHTWQVPTLTVLHGKAFFDDPALATDPRLQRIPETLRNEWLADRQARLARGAAYLNQKRARYADEAWTTGFFAREGVPLLAGTDAGLPFSYPGFSLHDELALLVEAGLSPLDALRAATIAPADYLGERDTMGSVDAGRVADLLLRRDPLAAIDATRDIAAVVLRGRLIQSGDGR